MTHYGQSSNSETVAAAYHAFSHEGFTIDQEKKSANVETPDPYLLEQWVKVASELIATQEPKFFVPTSQASAMHVQASEFIPARVATSGLKAPLSND